MNPFNLSVKSIINLQDQCIFDWKQHSLSLKQTDFYALVEQNHSWNFQLWLAEDQARRDDQGFEYVYHAKRAIDQYNQQRNNMMEQIDEYLYKTLNPCQKSTCPVHSESPGMMIDRLSILALKIYHMNLQTKRPDVPVAHQQLCTKKLTVLNAQREQLADCLVNLFEEIKQEKRTFRVYHQFKMYNDPNLNPELYTPKI